MAAEEPAPNKVGQGQEMAERNNNSIATKLLIAATALAALLVFLDSSIIVPASNYLWLSMSDCADSLHKAIPIITSEFGSITDIGWYSSIYLLLNCAVQPLIGKAYAIFPLKKVFISSLVTFEAGSLICALAMSSPTLVVGRAVAGMGAAGLLNGSLVIVTALVSLQSRAGTLATLGIVLAIAQLGSALGPVLGGTFTQLTTWRWCFYINLPLAAPIILAILLLPCPKYALELVHVQSKIRALLTLDWPGFLLFTGCVTIFLLALQFGSSGEREWSSATVIGLFIGGAVNLVVFLLWERRKGQSALIPLKTLTNRVVLSSSLTFFLQMGNLIITLFYFPLWFQLSKSASPIDSGLYLLPMIGTQLIAVITIGAIAKKVGQHLPFALVNGILVAVGSGLATQFNQHTSTGYWVSVELIIGAGRGFGLQMPLIAIQHHLAPDEAMIGTSIAIFFQYFGGAVFSGIAETVLASSLRRELSATAPALDAGKVLAAGGRFLNGAESGIDSPLVMAAYNKAIDHVFWLMTATAIAMTLTCLGMGWRSRSEPEEALDLAPASEMEVL